MLAVDADNTLWGGIVGEDGADGVIVGDSFPGNGFRALQNGLAYQVANGTLLVMVSKNNDTDVAELFAARHGDLVLTDKHFATKRVDWNSKADNLVSIAEELNLGIDSFVFIDDNDVELEEVRQRLPDVRVIKVTDEPDRDRRAHLDAVGVPVRQGLERGPAAHLDDAGRGRPQGRGRRRPVARGLPRLARPDRARVPARSPPTSAG